MEIPVRVDQAKEYLENKYHESFTLYSSASISIDQPYAELIFFSESHPQAPVRVYDDEKEMRDNYFGILAKEPMQALIEEAVKEAGGNGKVFFRFRSHFFSAECTDPALLTQLLEEQGDFLTVNLYLFTDQESAVSEEAFSHLCDALKERKLAGSVMCYLVNAAELEDLNEDSYDDYLVSDYRISPVQKAFIRQEGE